MLLVTLWRGAQRSALPVDDPSLGVLLESVPSPVRLAALASSGPAKQRAEAAATIEPPLSGAPSTPSAREFLAGYYGEGWPEIQRSIETSGLVDLDTPYVYTPWEDVALEFERSIGVSAEGATGIVRSKLQWPERPTAEFLAGEYDLGGRQLELDEPELDAIHDLVASDNAAITLLAEDFAARLDFHVRARWHTGAFLRSPFTTAGLGAERGFHSQSHGGFGWAVTITLAYEDYPDMEQLDLEIQALQEQRDRRVLQHLRTRLQR